MMSYDEICERLGCAKSTVAYHCSDKVKKTTQLTRNNNRNKNRQELKMLYGGKCKICGYNNSLSALEFHHLDKKTKIGTVGRLLTEKSKKAAYDEAKKCILICGNCHCEYHDGLIDVESSKR